MDVKNLSTTVGLATGSGLVWPFCAWASFDRKAWRELWLVDFHTTLCGPCIPVNVYRVGFCSASVTFCRCFRVAKCRTKIANTRRWKGPENHQRTKVERPFSHPWELGYHDRASTIRLCQHSRRNESGIHLLCKHYCNLLRSAICHPCSPFSRFGREGADLFLDSISFVYVVLDIPVGWRLWNNSAGRGNSERVVTFPHSICPAQVVRLCS